MSFKNQFSEEKSHYAKAVCYEAELPIVTRLSHLCLLTLEGDEMNNPDSAQCKIELNERRGDDTFKMHNINALLKVFFNKEKEIALEKMGSRCSLLLRLYVLVSWLVHVLLRTICQLALSFPSITAHLFPSLFFYVKLCPLRT